MNFKHRKVDSSIRIKADLIVLAIGQRIELGDLKIPLEGGEAGALPKGVFAAGDIGKGEKTVVYAVANGKKAAEDVDAYLGGK